MTKVKTKDIASIKSKIIQLPWGGFLDAYGSASTTPQIFLQLIDGNPDEKADAVNDLLWSRAYHQHDVFSITPSVLTAVIELLQVPDLINQRTSVGRSLLEEFIHFIRLCADGSRVCGDAVKLEEQIKEAVQAGVDLYKQFSTHENRRVAQDALWLVAFSNLPQLVAGSSAPRSTHR